MLKGFQVAGAGELGGQSGLAEVVTFLGGGDRTRPVLVGRDWSRMGSPV